MNDAATISALALAFVFVWAAVAKATSVTTVSTAFAALGLPAPRALAVLVPLAEVVIAIVLLARPDVGGALALTVLAVFTAVIVRALLAKSTAGCGCFGSHRVAQISPRDIARNGLLAGMAVIATATARLAAPFGLALALVAVASLGASIWVRRQA